MTDSRETVRRKEYAARARERRSPAPVPLTALCIIVGCLCRREGANLCPSHQNPDLPKAKRCHEN